MNIIAGFLSGLAGAMGLGGGSLLLLYLAFVLSVPQINAQGINLLFFIPCAITSIFFHHRNKLVRWDIVLPVAMGGIAGVFCGLRLLSVIDPSLLSKIFGAFLVVFGLSEMFIKK
ncbi:MAG: TSUP family transporter [Acutalibacteraceae bacterium]|jgi:uncharacterized membrane protein YfcA